jgi:pimeloyl-ACP methyl ester carboxylesterase
MRGVVRVMRSALMLAISAAAMTCAITSTAMAGPAPLHGGCNCKEVTIPVGLQPGQPVIYHIWAEFCLPPGRTPTTVQLLVHGGTYNHDYWDFGVIDGIDYSYVNAALAAGYAVLDIDRLGDGQSSHPPSTDLTFTNTIYTLHEVIQALRSGAVGISFPRVMYVGHSFGSAYGGRDRHVR